MPIFPRLRIKLSILLASFSLGILRLSRKILPREARESIGSVYPEND